MSSKELCPLYLEWAIEHMVAINKAMYDLSRFSNLNMSGIIQAIFAERQKLIDTDANYKKAYEILVSIGLQIPEDDNDNYDEDLELIYNTLRTKPHWSFQHKDKAVESVVDG
jgi:hypothetical protein